jgi:precorrin-2 dehydrogenase/sirohydrochlorin ferrochelatase
MKLYPITINIEGRLIAMIGGGNVALCKTRDLLETGANVTVMAPEIHDGFNGLVNEYGDRIELVKREYVSGSLGKYSLVFSATNSAEVNNAVYTEAHSKNIFINVVDDPQNCSFFIPSFTRKGDLILSLSTSGCSPAYAARLRRALEEQVPENIEEILTVLAELREKLKKDKSFSHMETKKRGSLLKRIANDDTLLSEACKALKEKKLKAFLLNLT